MRSTPTMIAKIAKGADFHGVLCYNYDKVARGEAEVVGGQGLPIRAEGGYDFHACLRRLEDLAAAGPRVRTPVLHCSLNPHPDDALTDAQMRAIAADYMRRMGYGDQPYLLFRHTDTGRTHYHIVSLRVDARGRKIADGNDLYRSRRATDELERAYGLHPKRTPGEAQGARQAAGAGERAGHAAHIRARVGEALGAYACQSLGELNALLEPMGIRARETRRQKGGRALRGIAYTRIDARGQATTPPIFPGALGRGFGHAALQRHFAQSRGRIAAHAPRLQDAIARAMAAAPGGLAAYREALRREGLELVARANAQGRIYGATYIDRAHGIAVNGSRLGRAFAAAALNARFGDGGAAAPRAGIAAQPEGRNALRTAAAGADSLQRQLDRAFTSIPRDQHNSEETDQTPRQNQRRKRKRRL